MDAILYILFVGVLTGLTTSIIASLIHRMSWHRHIKKSEGGTYSIFISNLYQFNRNFLGALSLSRELIINIIILNILFLIYCSGGREFGLECLIYSYLIVCFIRTLFFVIIYARFYDEKLVDFK
jgi:hypothetical protein